MGARPRPAEPPDWAELPPPPPLPPRAGALESCVKATTGPQSRSPARPTGCGTSSLLSTLGKGTRLARAPVIRGKGGGGRPPTPPGGQEGHQQAGEQSFSLSPDPGRASRQVRARTPGACQPGPSRPQRPDAAESSTAARIPPAQPDPSLSSSRVPQLDL